MNDPTPVQTPKILVVDDEQHQLDTVCRGLFLYGYRCTGVLSVGAALEALVGAGGDPYDLVLTDLTMPGGSGVELIEQISRERPDLPVIVITGLAATREIERVRTKKIPLLQKPFEPDTLDAVIRRVLHRD